MRFLLELTRQIRTWDTPSKIALAIALVLVIVMIILAIVATGDLQRLALITAFGLVIVAQIIVMWGNRNMLTPYAQAQRHFMNGDFEAARHTLEAHLNESSKPNADALTLLGNVCRNLGDLDASVSAISQALELEPDYHFALYGAGKTLLAQGDYAQAADFIEQAIQAGAPQVVQFDLAYTYYQMGELEQAANRLTAIEAIMDEPHRSLMTVYILFQAGIRDFRPPPDLIEAGLAYWQTQAQLFQHTPYGQAVDYDSNTIANLYHSIQS